jgi:DNA topoisomerase-1
MTDKEDLLKRQIAELRQHVTLLKQGKYIPTKSDKDEEPEEAPDGGADEEGKPVDPEAAAAKKKAQKAKAEAEAHLYSRQPSVSDVESRIATWESKLNKHQLAMRNKDENKVRFVTSPNLFSSLLCPLLHSQEVALGTSKINYMDPRITVAWCKKVECPIERVFPRTLLAKFPWAMGVNSQFKW